MVSQAGPASTFSSAHQVCLYVYHTLPTRHCEQAQRGRCSARLNHELGVLAHHTCAGEGVRVAVAVVRLADQGRRRSAIALRKWVGSSVTLQSTKALFSLCCSADACGKFRYAVGRSVLVCVLQRAPNMLSIFNHLSMRLTPSDCVD